MPTHRLLRKLASGEVAVGAWATIPSSVSAEMVGAAGFDYVCVDTQHGLVGYTDSVPMLQAVGLGDSTPLVRVPGNTLDSIGKALDAGALGVIVPMVSSREECEAAMDATRYPPLGSRSFGPTRAAPHYGGDYLTEAQNDLLCIPMIETAQAVESIDEILQVSGLHVVYIGPSDLAVSMGHRPGSEEPSFLDALDKVVAACERHNVVPGIHCTDGKTRDRLERGFRMVTVSSDTHALRAKLAADRDGASVAEEAARRERSSA